MGGTASLSKITHHSAMRALTAYLTFTVVALGITTYTVNGLASGLADLQSERNAQIQQLRNR